jgi:hypothetical protein
MNTINWITLIISITALVLAVINLISSVRKK